jgi:hypothetical protein
MSNNTPVGERPKKHFANYNAYEKVGRNTDLSTEEIEKREVLKQEIQNKYFKDSFLIVDSNVFMDVSSDWFFDMITSYYLENDSCLEMFADQYHEMNNKKSKAVWNSPIRKVATKALQRIEKMIDDNVLHIIGLDSTSNRKAYGDGCFFDEINKNPERKYCIISRDLDLRIRMKNKFRSIDCTVLNLKDCDYRNV